MEQRALIASLVLGCVTAAGAGGYLAVRQMAPAPEATIATTTPAPDPTEGTVADLAASEPVAEPARAPEGSAPPRPAATSLPARSQPAGTAGSPAPTPRPSAPARPATTTRADSTGPSAPPAPAASPAPEPSAPREQASRDTWPAPVAEPQGSDSRWPARDRETSATTAEASLPSRPAVSEPVEAQAALRRLENVTIPADAVIGVQIETTVNSDRSRVEDAVKARVTRDVTANGVVVIPAGTRLLGSVMLVDEGGRIKERARLGVRFHTLVFANGDQVRLPTETIYREGEQVAGRAAARIGGAAIGGAILGAIMGGGKGAVIGAATGAGSGTGWAMAGDRKPAELRAGQSLAVRVSDTVMTQIER